MANLEGAARSIVVDMGRGASSVSAARLCTSLCRGVTVWRNPASGLFVREKFSCVYLHAAGRETGWRCLAEGESPCGVRDCTLRRVLEYLPQSTRVLSARHAGGLRTTMRGFGGRAWAAGSEAGGPGRRAVAGMPMAWRSKDC